MARGSICQAMDKAQNRGKLSEMDPEWSPGAVKEAPSFQLCLDFDCARSRGQEGPPMASSGRNWPSGRGRQNQLLRCSIGAPRFGAGGIAQPPNSLLVVTLLIAERFDHTAHDNDEEHRLTEVGEAVESPRRPLSLSLIHI